MNDNRTQFNIPQLEDGFAFRENLEGIDATQAPMITNASKSRTRVGTGMNGKIYDAILNLKQDFKRVTEAMTKQGAENMVDRHNATSPYKWGLTVKDLNGDNIDDIIIHDANAPFDEKPIYINGWTTKTGDYPLRSRYLNSTARKKGTTYADYKMDLRRRHPNFYDFAKEYGWGGIRKPLDPENPSDQMKIAKRKASREDSAYTKFKALIPMDTVNNLIRQLQNDDSIPAKRNKNGEMVLPRKIALVARAFGLLWNRTVINNVRNAWGVTGNDEKFNKMKNTAEGKLKIKIATAEFIQWALSQKNNHENYKSLLFMFCECLVHAVGEAKDDFSSMEEILGNRDEAIAIMKHKYPSYNDKWDIPAPPDDDDFDWIRGPATSGSSGNIQLADTHDE